MSFCLSHHFLIAMPQIARTPFASTVVYVCEHSKQGAFGLVINRPTPLEISKLLRDAKWSFSSIESEPVFFGGPVQTEHGFVLYEDHGTMYHSSFLTHQGVYLTTSREILEALAQGQGPSRFFVALGYSGWHRGQLEEEIARNHWLTVEADLDLIFDVPAERRYSQALKQLGVDKLCLSGDVGHA